MKKVVVIGGGASGMMSAYASAKNGNNVILIEKNEKLGKKIYITGKGRCNLTNASDNTEFLNNVINNPKFLFSAINTLSTKETIEFFENNGLKLKEERGKRIFPNSDKASDVNKTLEKLLNKLNVEVLLNTSVEKILVKNSEVIGVKTNKEEILCDSVIVCTGGISYPLTGSTGDGYLFAKSNGHTIIEPKPALVGIELKGSDFVDLQGLSLKNVKLYAMRENKVLYSDFGEMLFTHYGISGPIVLSCSSVINKQNLNDIKLVLDLKPAVDNNILDNRLIREFKENNTKNVSTMMHSILPKSLIDLVLRRANVKQNKNCSEITAVERQNIIHSLKSLEFKISKLRPIEEAIITSGGVSVKEINPKTMESKMVKGLFFAGEVLDVDAFTGGFNLQIAFSTGYLAGLNS